VSGKEKPILFSTPMVQAILSGNKSMTRRVVKPQPTLNGHLWELGGAGWSDTINSFQPMPCHSLYNRMKYKPGDILWVRETWGVGIQLSGGIVYKADYINQNAPLADGEHWKPSIFMLRAAARIFLRVTNVRIEQLLDITENDAIAEGVTKLFDYLSSEEYSDWRNRIITYCGVEFDPGEQENHGYTNYLWHGHFGKYGLGNKHSNKWDYQYSSYKSARDSFSSLWHLINAKRGYSWESNPWVWVIEFERIKNYADKQGVQEAAGNVLPPAT